MDVDIFIPCFVDQLYAETGLNFVKILEKAGCRVFYNKNQTCCGQPSFNSGYVDEAKKLAVKFLNDFSGQRVIVGPSASCIGYIKHKYLEMFNNDTDKINMAELVTGNIFEMTDFLVNKIKVTDFGAYFPHKVTYHDSCSALRDYKIKQEPRILLSKVKGLELLEMSEAETCCGFGGTFSVKHSAISQAMVEQKVENALETGVEYIVTTESSCLLNIESYIKKNNSKIKVIHIADILCNF
ncbi:MAG: (Fe-S)-binding protein [Bacteroidales bacterium]|nr:(Fe-S)-binding protein [Bacteroidales bacterium]